MSLVFPISCASTLPFHQFQFQVSDYLLLNLELIICIWQRLKMSWQSVRCEPGVLTQVNQEMEVKGVRIEELHSLDSQWLNDLLPVYGLIFLPRYRLPENDDDDRPVLDSDIPNLFFAKQQVNNACPTHAIISILMNEK